MFIRQPGARLSTSTAENVRYWDALSAHGRDMVVNLAFQSNLPILRDQALVKVTFRCQSGFLKMNGQGDTYFF
jgi:hypothetical protein